MTDSEKLAKQLIQCWDDLYSSPTLYEKADFAKRMAEKLIARGLTMLPESGIGDMSDGYHTFNELYHHRAVLFSTICNARPDLAWKSKLHDTGDMYEGMFIVGIETKEGQATYHYDIDPYWDMFNVPVLDRAPVWDGHTPQQAIDRIANGVVVSKMETTTKWIPVTERLPDNLDAYLVVVMYKYNHELEYSYDTDVATFDPSGDAGYIDGVWSTYNDWDEGQDCLTVTHWMPLPEPPRGE